MTLQCCSSCGEPGHVATTCGHPWAGARSKHAPTTQPPRTRGRVEVISQQQLQLDALYTSDVERPQTRADCLPGGCNEQRPCPFVGCRHHMYLEINPETGTIKLNFPDLEPDELEHSCSLDEADEGEHTLIEIGERLNLTRERVRQLETEALSGAGGHGVYRQLRRNR